MTPEQVARAVLCDESLLGLNGARFPEQCEKLIAAAILEAAAEEREACARVADAVAAEIAGPMSEERQKASDYVLLKQARRVAEKIRGRGKVT